MRRFPFGSDAMKLPSVTKLAFKAGVGAYLGWSAARAVDAFVTTVIIGVAGEPEAIASKIINKITPKKL